MPNEIKNVGTCRVEMTYAVPKDAWEKAQEKAFDKLAANITVKGFRKGQAPKHLVSPQIDPTRLFNEAVDNAIPEAYAACVSENKVRPYGTPSVNVTKVSRDELELTFTVALYPTVKLGAYKGLHADKDEVKLEDGAVDAEIKNMLAQNAILEVVERPAQMGDTVVFDFKGFIDGKPFEGGEAQNYALELGSGQFVPGFEEGLVGVNPNEDRNVEVTFPTNYVKELAGKKATFECKVHEVKEKVVPELNDEAAEELGIENVKTVDELKKNVEERLLKNKEQQSKQKYLNAIIEQIVKGSEIEMPDELVNDEAKHSEEDLKNRVTQNGLTFEQYLEVTGATEESLREQFKAQANEGLKQFLAINQIGLEEKLVPEEAELEAEYARIAAQYGMEAEQVKKALEPQKDQLLNNLRTKKIEDFILANND